MDRLSKYFAVIIVCISVILLASMFNLWIQIGALAQEEKPALFFQDPTPRPACDALNLVRVARAAILDPKDTAAKKNALETLDKCERIWTLLEKQLSARPVEQPDAAKE